ncbi:MAG: N-acetyl-gamma-glutamyl-phosphate reductase [Eubacteriales bacterium]|nr:N-acetyl-gamma-glutamyl-phosphate reductase [Eubacteriales bacterium]
MIRVGILGATGYVGIEITRLLLLHPGVEVSCVVSHSFAGKKISDVYPHLAGITDLYCEEMDVASIHEKADLFITALSEGISSEVIPLLLEKGKKVIDHGGDFRYKSVEIYEKWYGKKHTMPHLLGRSVYGLPELYRDSISTASLVANPGCYPTCSILAAAPLMKNRIISTDNIIIDAASGVTGAGRKTDLPFQYSECSQNFKAYSVSTHRHTSEIEQEFGNLAGAPVLISFTPHLVPMKRGMMCTLYANLKKRASTAEILSIYEEYYKEEFFVRIMPEGRLPETKYSSGSNFIDIGVVADERLGRVIIVSALDNLGKGAAWQAVQSLNIMCGYDETTGLKVPGLYL